MDGITRGHLVREAVGWGIPPALAQRSVEETLERLRAGMDVADSRYPYLPVGVRSQVARHFARLKTSTLD